MFPLVNLPHQYFSTIGRTGYATRVSHLVAEANKHDMCKLEQNSRPQNQIAKTKTKMKNTE